MGRSMGFLGKMLRFSRAGRVGTGRAAAPSVPGHVVEVETVQDGARRRVDVLVFPEGVHAHHAAVRIDFLPERPPMLCAGFAAQVREVCLPEHLEPQEKVVEAAAEVLGQIVAAGDRERLVAALLARWAKERARLEARQAEIAAMGQLAERVELDRSAKRHAPIVTCPPTRIAKQELHGSRKRQLYGVRFNRSALNFVYQGDLDPVPLTAEALAPATSLSGHEKLELLSAPDRLLGQLREGFLTRPNIVDPRAVPVPRDGWIAWYKWNTIRLEDRDHDRRKVEVHTPSGARGEVAVWDYQDDGAFATVRAFDADGAHSIQIRTGDTNLNGCRPPPSIERFKGQSAFPSLETLDATLRLALEFLVAVDPRVDDVRMAPVEHVLDDAALAAHPLLAGLDVPARLRPILAILLGSPYEAARREAEKEATRKAQKMAKREAVADIADGLPDGAVVGKVDRRQGTHGRLFNTVSGGIENSTRLGIVRTLPPSGRGRRTRRVIEPIRGFTAPRALTKTHLARMPVLDVPTALRGLHDAFLGGQRRDLNETAFRLSLRLTGGAANPLLDGTTDIREIDAAGDLRLRHTLMAGDAGCWAQAFAVTCAERHHSEPLFTGAGFVVTVVDGKAEHYLRPALIDGELCLPKEHRAILGEAVAMHLPDQASAALAALDALWDRGPRARKVTL